MALWASAMSAACSLATMPQADHSNPAPIRSAPPVRNAWPAQLSGTLQPTGGRERRIHIFPPALKKRLGVRAKKCLSPTTQTYLRNRRNSHVSSSNSVGLLERTSLTVYDADIFSCSRHFANAVSGTDYAPATSG